MQTLAVRLKGVTRYTEELNLDLRGIDPGLIAICGPNGSGKTTLMECMAPVPMFLELPSYPGKLAASCQPSVRDSVIETTIAWAGHEWRHLIQIDPAANAGSGKTLAYLFRDGKPVPEWPTPGRTGDYLEAMAAIYPAQSVFLAAAFSVQDGSGSWFQLDKAKRRDLFARLLGLGRLQELTERSRRHRKAHEAAAETLSQLGRELGQQQAQRTELEAKAEARVVAVTAADKVVDKVGPRHRQAVGIQATAAAAHRQALHEYSAAETQRATLVQRRDEAETSRAAAWMSLDVRLAILEAREEVASTAENAKQRRGARSTLVRLSHEAAQDQATAERAMLANQQQIDTARTAEARLTRSVDQQQERRRKLAELRPLEEERTAIGAELDASPAATDAPEAGVEVDAARAVRQLKREHDNLERTIAGAATRAALISRVPCGGRKLDVTFDDGDEPADGVVDCSKCELLTSAQAAANTLGGDRERLAELLRDIGLAEGAHTNAAAALATARDAVEQRLGRVSRHKALAYVPDRITEINAEIEQGAADAEALEATRATLSAALEEEPLLEQAAGAATSHRANLGRELATVDEELAGYDGIDERVAAITAAAAEEPLFRQQMETAQSAKAQAEQDLAKLPEPDGEETAATDEALAAADLALAQVGDEINAATMAARQARESQAFVDGRLAELDGVDARAVELSERRVGIEGRAAGWLLVEQALGRDGIQALEIDAAGPEISELINELLTSCFGPRFSCSLRTVQPAGGGKKQREVFDLEILDGARNGQARGAARYSIGERTLISEALKLALAIFNARRQPVPLLTLWRDECDGALEPRLAAAYPQMLRRARDLGGYQWVYLISHNRDVWSQADTTITLDDDGGAEIERLQ